MAGPGITAQVTHVAGVAHVRLVGSIDETFSGSILKSDLAGQVILDLGRVQRISSFGVRKWIEFTSKLNPGVLGLYLVNVPPVVVDQLNLVEGFGGVSCTLRVLAPYRCEGCDADRVRGVDLRKHAEALGRGEVPAFSCTICRTKLSFADEPSEYFGFLRYQPKVEPDPQVLHYLERVGLSEVAPDPATGDVGSGGLKKLVRDDISFYQLPPVLKADLNVRKLSAGLEGRVVYDFGNVLQVQPQALEKLEKVLTTASESAEVLLWRVPPYVLQPMEDFKLSQRVKVATVSVARPCAHCGGEPLETLPALLYLQHLSSKEGPTAPCVLCGSPAALRLYKGMEGPLAKLELAASVPAFAELAEQALTQDIKGSDTGPGVQTTPSDAGRDGTGTGPQLTLLKPIGQGGMASVFLARQVGVKGIEKYVVVKKVLQQFAESPDFVEMLFAEARASARLTHPNVVQIYDVGVMDGSAFLTMEYVRGPDVKKILRALAKLPLRLPTEHALRIVADTAAGLHYAHSYVDPTGTSHPMVHRDVSPHNILVSLDGAIKLSDFGIAKVEGESQHTRPGTMKGKLDYVSPEVISGMQVDGRADVFSLGIVLYELLTGKLPFRRESEAGTLRAVMQDTPQSPSELNPEVPRDVSDLAMRALEKHPADRTGSAAQLRQEIEAAMGLHGFASSPSSVAKFLRDNLGHWLQEFGPDANAETAERDRSPSRQNSSLPYGVTGSGPGRPHTPTKGKAGSGPSAPPPLPSVPPVPLTPSRGQLSPSPFSRPPAAARASLAAPRSVPPSWSAEEASPLTPTVMAEPLVPTVVARNTKAGTPRPAGTAPPPALRAAMAPPVRTAPPPEVSGMRLALRLGIFGFLVGLAAFCGVYFIRGANHALSLENLASDEHLYVQGIRVVPNELKSAAREPVMVAVARGGRMTRFGALALADGADLGALVPADPDLASRPDATGTLDLAADAAGCHLSLDGSPQPGEPKGKVELRAGKEILVQLDCPGHKPWERYVMVVPGQAVGAETRVGMR